MRKEMGTNKSGRSGQCRVLGVHVSGLTVRELHNRIASLIENEKRALVLNVNVHALNLAYKRPWLREFLNRAHLVFCDGAGVVLGARILGCDLGRRITYADWMWQLAAFCEQHEYALYFVGARPGVAERAAASLKARYPGLRVAGTQHGYANVLARVVGHGCGEPHLRQPPSLAHWRLLSHVLHGCARRCIRREVAPRRVAVCI